MTVMLSKGIAVVLLVALAAQYTHACLGNWHQWITIETTTPRPATTTQKVVCPRPPLVVNAVYEDGERTSYEPGEVIVYTCVSQPLIGLYFNLVGEDTNTCMDNGLWAYAQGSMWEALPRCVPVDTTCPQNQEYQECGTACPKKCGDDDNESIECPDVCKAGCGCPSKAPYLRDDGYCVAEEACPSDIPNAGSWTEWQEADDYVQQIAFQLQNEVQEKLGAIFQITFHAVSYRSQVVAGVNYEIKVDVGGRWILLSVYQSLSEVLDLQQAEYLSEEGCPVYNTCPVEDDHRINLSPDSIICPQQLCDVINDPDVLFIDVRACAMIGDTPPINGVNWMNLPMAEIDSALDMTDSDFEEKYHHRKPTRDERVIVYCQTSIAASRALDVLRQNGFTNAVHFPGSSARWKCLKENFDFCPEEINDRELSDTCAIISDETTESMTMAPQTTTEPAGCTSSPPDVENASTMTNMQSYYMPGFVANYMCNEGYIFDGSDDGFMYMCNDDGTWSTSDENILSPCLPVDVASDFVVVFDNDRLVDDCDEKAAQIGAAPHFANSNTFSTDFPNFNRQLDVAKMINEVWRSNSSRWAWKYATGDCSGPAEELGSQDYGLLRVFDDESSLEQTMSNAQYECVANLFHWSGIKCSDKYLDSQQSSDNRKAIVIFAQNSDSNLYTSGVWGIYVSEAVAAGIADVFVISTLRRDNNAWESNVNHWNEIICNRNDDESCLLNGAFIGSQWDEPQDLMDGIREFYQ